jgi:hypothetical protein
MHVGGIFCDLAKASDCLSHNILLTKLHFMAFKEQLQKCSHPNNWIEKGCNKITKKQPNFFLKLENSKT